MIATVLLAIALGADAFAVALTQGARYRPDWQASAIIALTFGLFQGFMPLIGWGIGMVAFAYIEAVDHWIAFGLLAFLGVRMLRGDVGEDEAQRKLTGAALLAAGVATSIDALAAGITLPTLGVAPLVAAGVIAGITLVMSAIALAIGRRAGERWGVWAERAGGIILIALGVRIVLDHTGLM